MTVSSFEDTVILFVVFDSLHYTPSRVWAKRKYTSRDRASTMVEIKGLAITAGSRCTALARIGRLQPTILAHTTVTAKVRHTTASTIKVIS